MVAEARLVKAFCQVNTVKGWRYLDDAGKVMNHFADEFEEMKVGLNGLLLNKPGAIIDEARVTAKDIWIGFTRPATGTYVGDQAWRYVQTVANIIGVESVSRVGVRLQYLLPTAIAQDQMAAIARTLVGGPVLSIPGAPTSTEVSLELQLERGLQVTLRFQPVKLRPSEVLVENLPTEGLMFDSDVSRSGTINLAEARVAIRQAIAWSEDNVPAMVQRVATEIGIP